MAWAVFETAVIEIADLLRAAHKIPLRIVALKGDLEIQTKRYVNDVLKFPFTDFEPRLGNKPCIWAECETSWRIRRVGWMGSGSS